MVADYDDMVVGFMVYELHKTRLSVLDIAVDPDMRRKGVGTVLVDKLKGKLSLDRRNRIALEVRETTGCAVMAAIARVPGHEHSCDITKTRRKTPT